jgi:hypothetical protein
VSVPVPPPFEPRRRHELLSELLERARVWLPEWRPHQPRADFASALFEIAARLGADVTQRLDRAPEKTFRGFLDWLGVRGLPGQAARLPVVFTLAAGAQPVQAEAPVQLQATPPGKDPIFLETEQALRILPGRLDALVAGDPAADAFTRPPPGVLGLEPPPAGPTEWRLVSGAALGDSTLQLDPTLGLEPGLVLEDPRGHRYRVVAVKEGIVSIDPPVGSAQGERPGLSPAADLVTGDRLVRPAAFDGFAPAARNEQQHHLLLGSDSALAIESPAVIEVVNGGLLPVEARWSYSGPPGPSGEPTWIDLEVAVIDQGRLFLWKPAGAIASAKVAGRSARWLRLTRAPGAFEPMAVGALRLKVNCRDNPEWKWPPAIEGALKASGAAGKKPLVALEGIANTSPIVLDAPFYPLGREPRLFDAFYLGGQEALSKAGARVTLSFKMGDGFSAPAAAVVLGPSEHLVAAIGDDGKLHRLWHDDTAATVEFLAAVEMLVDSRATPLTPGLRPGAALYNGSAYVTAAAGTEVYRWSQSNKTTAETNFVSLGAPGAVGAAAAAGDPVPPATDTVLVRTGAGLVVYALAGGQLFCRNAIAADPWQLVAGKPAELARLAPVVASARVPAGTPRPGPGELDEADGLAVLTASGQLMMGGGPFAWTKLGNAALDPGVYPLLVKDDLHQQLWAFGALSQSSGLEARSYDLLDNDGDGVADDVVAAAGQSAALMRPLVGHALDFDLSGGAVVALAVVETALDRTPRPIQWEPQDGTVLEGPTLAGSAFVEAPLSLGSDQLFLCGRGEVALAGRAPPPAATITAPLTDAALFERGTKDWSGVGNLLMTLDVPPTTVPQERETRIVAGVLDVAPEHWAFLLDQPGPPRPADTAITVYRRLHPVPFTGTQVPAKPTRLKLAGGDPGVTGGLLHLSWVDSNGNHTGVWKVITGGTTGVELDDKLPAATVKYWKVVEEPASPSKATFLPALDVTGVTSPGQGLLRDVLSITPPGLEPARQVPRFLVDRTLVLAAPWQTLPQNPLDFTLSPAFGALIPLAPPRGHNPQLSWEYWDGRGWWRIPGVVDGTADLVTTGDVRFCVPANLQPTDVVGRTNHWIRARLVGGDYGKEAVTVVSGPGPVTNSTKQTVERSSDGIRAPYVLLLEGKYEVCCAVTPAYLLTEDGGGLLDQSDANRTSGAQVALFVPLSRTLAPLGADGARALYLGFDQPLQGRPISLLFLADEGEHEGAFPLRVEVLTDGRFQPIGAEDGTRGLNESGVLAFELAEAPRPATLFGKVGHWLRLQPRAGFSGEWRPKIRRAFLNATWASAAETQRLEGLGSSDGSPDQRVTLARPPVLAGSLLLRVREPLGEDEIGELRRPGPDAVLDTLAGRPGPWVRWSEVDDPTDHGPEDRVFSVDYATGSIAFGNGAHGRVPPPGRDSILAERYRQGGGEDANLIAAWSALNLNTPLQGVEGVVVPEGAAGGADPQDVATTLRFAPANLSLRGRALALRDFEQLALQHTRDVAQARALRTARGVRLVVVMRGRQPRPSKAFLRGLRRDLEARTLPALAGAALALVEPALISIRIRLTLTIDAIEWSGTVAARAQAAVEGLLDPASGGLTGTGWRLGEIPTDDDLAASLTGIEHLESVDGVTIERAGGDDPPPARAAGAACGCCPPPASSAAPAPLGPLRPEQLLRLVPDGVVVQTRVEPTEAA